MTLFSLRAAAIAAAMVMGAAATPASAQLVNGSFDLPTPGNQPPDTIFGWDTVPFQGVGLSSVESRSQSNNATFNQAADYIQQTFTVASAGAYVLSFFTKTSGSAPGTFSFIQALINGAVVAVGGSDSQSYAQTTKLVQLNAGTNILAFTSVVRIGNPDVLRLDDVSIEAVPGPLAGSGLLSFALAGIGFMGYRVTRRRKHDGAPA